MPTSKKKTLLVLDSNALIHRAYHALPPLTNSKGMMTNAVYGFVSILLKVLKELKPDYIAAAFDLEGPTFRDKKYAAYKATREKANQELYDQFPLVRDFLKAASIPVYEKKGYEADDVIGTIVASKAVDRPDTQSIIVTGDMDSLQLVDENTKVYTLRKGFSDTVLMDAAIVKERYGFGPEHVVDYKALAGDPSDNIPGIKGIGKKTATELIAAFGGVDEIYAALTKDDKRFEKFSPRVTTLLADGKKDARLSKELATIVTDAPVAFSFDDASVEHFDRERTTAFLRENGFKSLLARVPEGGTQSALSLGSSPATPAKKNGTYHLVDSNEALEALLRDMRKQKVIAIDTETTGLNPLEADLIGISVAWGNDEAWYINLNDNQGHDNSVHTRSAWITKLKPLVNNPSIRKIGHNIKYDLAVLERAGITLAPLSIDTMIVSYLLHPEGHRHGLDALAKDILDVDMISITSLIGKGKDQKSMQSVPLPDLAAYAAEDADMTWRLEEELIPKLDKQGVRGLFDEVEMPLIPVLHRMEQHGVTINTAFFRKMSKKITCRAAALEKKAHDFAGREFNLASPAQLKDILFTTLGLDASKLGFTKTGHSTRADELEKIRGAHPIIDVILEYRELTKLKSTYLDALPELISPTTGRIHTSFNQTIAATGRLSSTDPNLQNIPIRTPLGREVRKGFITKRGWRLISADYSQIELRVIASLANDEKMIAAFQAGDDIHARTAAEIHDKDIVDVTREERRAAKAINFGIIYGMGTTSLARQTGLSQKDAEAFIHRYFTLHSGIQEYLEQTKALAKKLGYVETLFGRRRYVPEIQSPARQVAASGERIAVNMPIQGTAADLIKKAMIIVDEGLHKISSEAAMLLQVHDELLFEAPMDDVARVSTFVKETMENVYKLRVPILVEVASGKNWDEAH